jgi:hypothetical protein
MLAIFKTFHIQFFVNCDVHHISDEYFNLYVSEYPDVRGLVVEFPLRAGSSYTLLLFLLFYVPPRCVPLILYGVSTSA